MDEILRRIARAITAAVGVDHCGFYVLSDDGGRLLPRLGIDRRPLPPASVETFLNQPLDPDAHPGLRQVLDEKAPLACTNAQTDPRVDPAMATALGLKSFLALPLTADGRVLAVALATTFDTYRAFTPHEIELAADIASAAAPALENARLLAESVHRLAENESIQRVTSTLLQGLDLKAVLQVVCREAQHLTGARGSSVYALEGDAALRLVSSTGEDPELDCIPVDQSLAGVVLRTGQLAVSNQAEGDERLFHSPAASPPSNMAVAPLCAAGRTVGVLYIANKPGAFTEGDTRLIRMFANQAAIAIVHAQLQQRVRALAALEERERLAREIHDNLAQALGLLKLQASRAADLLRGGQVEPAQAFLAELTHVASEAQADAREAIFNLRHSPGAEADLAAALRAQLERYRATYGLDVRLDLPEAGLADLPAPVVTQLTRIIQEALANVRKHARASQAWVRLELGREGLNVTIEDNGRGFDPAAVLEAAGDGAGLHIMRERAEGLGGRLDVVARPAAGTRIVAHMPLAALP